MHAMEPTTAQPAVVHPGDAEVDIEVLKSVPKEFCIDSEDRANWLVRKIVEARAYSERVKAWCDVEQRRAAREEQTLLFLFGRQIEAWTRDEIGRRNGRRKSLNLPAGCIGFRSSPARVVVDDESRVLAWARHCLPAAVVTTERLARSVLNEHCERTGELPDEGVHLEPATDRFFIK